MCWRVVGGGGGYKVIGVGRDWKITEKFLESYRTIANPAREKALAPALAPALDPSNPATQRNLTDQRNATPQAIAGPGYRSPSQHWPA